MEQDGAGFSEELTLQSLEDDASLEVSPKNVFPKVLRIKSEIGPKMRPSSVNRWAWSSFSSRLGTKEPL